MNGPLTILVVILGAALLVGFIVAADRLVDAGWAVADRWHERRTARRLNDAALSDASMRYVEREARRG